MRWRRGGLTLRIENIKATRVFSLLSRGGGLGSWDSQLPSSVLIRGFGKSVHPSGPIIHMMTLCVTSQASKVWGLLSQGDAEIVFIAYPLSGIPGK